MFAEEEGTVKSNSSQSTSSKPPSSQSKASSSNEKKVEEITLYIKEVLSVVNGIRSSLIRIFRVCILLAVLDLLISYCKTKLKSLKMKHHSFLL
jgi:hypothetical protein